MTSHLRAALEAAGLPATPPKPSETWDCLKPHISVPGHLRGFRKLSDQQVLDIRTRYAAGGITQQQLADEFDVDRMTVWNIINRQAHRRLEAA